MQAATWRNTGKNGWRNVGYVIALLASLGLSACGSSESETESLNIVLGSGDPGALGVFRADVAGGTTPRTFNATSPAGATVVLGPVTARYYVSTVSYSVSINGGPFLPINQPGTRTHQVSLPLDSDNQIVFRATEAGGRSVDSPAYMVSIRDLTGPVITLSGPDPAITPGSFPNPRQIVVALPLAQVGAAVSINIGTATVTDNVDVSPPLNINFNPVPVPDPMGRPNTYEFIAGAPATTVSYQSTDSAGHVTTVVQSVRVVAGVAITPPLDRTGTSFVAATAPLTPITVDNIAGGAGVGGIPTEVSIDGGQSPYNVYFLLPNNITGTPAGNIGLPPSSIDPGTGMPIPHVVTWVVEDSTIPMLMDQATQLVVVQDVTAPVITPPVNITTISRGATTSVTTILPFISDNVDVPFPSAQISRTVDGMPTPVGQTLDLALGRHTIIWTATDSAGNSSQAQQIITINPPAVACSSLKDDPAQFDDVMAQIIAPVTNGNALIPGSTQECVACHSLASPAGGLGWGGTTVTRDSDFDALRSVASDVAKRISDPGGPNDGLTYMVAKPALVAPVTHGGGTQLDELSAQFARLRDFTDAVGNCVADTVDPTGIDVGDHFQRLRKAKLALTGEIPTAAEEAQVVAALDEAAFDTVFTALLDQYVDTHPGFYERIKQMYNDVFLVDMFSYSTDAPDDNFDLRNFTSGGMFNDVDNSIQQGANYGLARAPLELIAEVVRTDRPFTEILTASYTMVNPYSASLYGVNAGAPGFPATAAGANINDFRRVDVLPSNTGNIPHAGVLTTNGFLARHPSSNTNVNRHRASMVYRMFLGLDLETLGNRADLDLLELAAAVMPTYDRPDLGFGSAQCITCHNFADPIAGTFKNWSNGGAYMGDSDWFGPLDRTRHTMLDPGFDPKPDGAVVQNDVMPNDGATRAAAVRWLGGRVAADSRFIDQTVRLAFREFTGQNYPAGALDAEQIRTDFVSSGLNFKELVKSIIKSPYFRAQNLDVSRDPNDFADIGMGRMLYPEHLRNKIRSVMGGTYEWEGPVSNAGLMARNSYMLFYGGHDSDTLVRRSTEPSAMMVAIQDRIANQASCENVRADFLRAQASRVLFPLVNASTLPVRDPATGGPDMGHPNDIAIMDNIRYLHKHILGEVLPDSAGQPHSQYIETYKLFADVAELSIGDSIPAACRGGGDANTNSETVLGWMAVVSYLVSDFKFFFE